MNLEDKVKELMCEVFEVEQVTPDISQKNCNRWDSLHHLTLASELEEAFDVEFEPEEIAEMTDYARVIAMVESKL